MNILQRTLKVHRESFDPIFEQLTVSLKNESPDDVELRSNLQFLEQEIEVLSSLDRKMFDLLVSSENTTDAMLATQSSISDSYVTKLLTVRLLVEKHFKENSADQESTTFSHRVGCCSTKNKLKLPKLEFQKFGGEIKNWIHWWSQFRRIHEDDSMELEDKYQYLIQTTIPKSRARSLVESFPASAENYPKAIESLKQRFGREEFLIEFYIRELLKLVINSLNNKSKLSFLYDNISCQLRSLETLNVSSETYSAMLFPLVESCLPEEIIRLWQRSSEYDESGILKDKLNKLMKFLEKEVNREEKIALVTASFETPKSRKSHLYPNAGTVPSASGLLNKIQKMCHFCKKEHYSQDCEEAKTWSLNDKKQKLKSTGCCLICMRVGHIARNCETYIVCSTCKGRHFSLLCWKTGNENNKSVEESVKMAPVETNLANRTYSKIFLQTMVIRLYNNHTSRNVRVIIDTDSEKSYIMKAMAEEMQYKPVREEKVIHALFGGTSTEILDHYCYRIRVSNLENTYACNFEVLDQLVICNNINSIKPGPWLQELRELDIQVTDVHECPIDVLIGADIAGKLFTGQKHELKCGLVALQTLLGWTLLGKTVLPSGERSTMSLAAITSTMTMINKDIAITELWNLDVLGITEPSEAKSKKEREDVLMQHFLETVRVLEDGRYEVDMPWLEDHAELPSNLKLCQRRLEKLKVKLLNEQLYDEYAKVFQEWLKEEVHEENKFKGHYLPHRHVVKESSLTTRIRPVFDASSRSKGYPSLNQCIDKGLNLIELIPSILTKFRLSKIGVVADIRKAFLQISLCPNDRDFLRFLWYNEEGQVKIFRHKRVVFGVTCSPFLLGAVLQHHLTTALENHHSQSLASKNTIEKLLNGLYVDNCVVSLDDKQMLENFITESTQLLAEAKMELRCWEHTVIEDLSISAEMKLTPVLGLYWNRNFDTLEIISDWFKNINLNYVTKREILSCAHKLFDPIGYTSAVTLYLKLLLQKTWENTIGWDTEVPEEIKSKFMQWTNQISSLIHLTIPRWILTQNSYNISLHTFCDACKFSCACAIFLRSETINVVKVQLVQAKSRVAPIKKISIPRLELLASTWWWSDSTAVLARIEREEQWKPFVFHRVQEIRSLTKKENWHDIAGNLNPADLPSRGCLPKYLSELKWWEGSRWLQQPPEEWPKKCYSPEEDIINTEKRRTVVSSLNTEETDYNWYHFRISSFKKIVKVFSWILRFLNNTKYAKEEKKGPLILEEISTAEKLIFKLIQKETFKDNSDFRLKVLCTFVDEDGLIRVTTKISARDDENEFLYSIVLPGKHPVVHKLIEEEHRILCHVGVQGLLSLLREKFWLLHGRKSIKEILHKCVICRRFNSKPLEVKPIPLPNARGRDANVFQVTGVDIARPLYDKNGRKLWICLYTCAIYRAVHLELLSSMSTENFLQSFMRFISRRGRPSVVYSDHGINFVGMKNALDILDWNKIREYSLDLRIDWKLIPVTAPWWGGWWERLIRIVKDLLKKILGHACLSYEELSTAICECESIVNCRPLTYLSEESTDPVPLTPAIFLRDISSAGVPDLDAVEVSDLTSRFKYKNKIKEHLRLRFRSEYLGQLKLFSSKKFVRDIQVGEVVLIGSDNKKRLDWPLACILELIPGRDGNSLLATLKTATGTVTRSLQRLYPLEVHQDEKSNLVEKFKHDQQIVQKSEVKEDNLIQARSGRTVKPPTRFTSN